MFLKGGVFCKSTVTFETTPDIVAVDKWGCSATYVVACKTAPNLVTFPSEKEKHHCCRAKTYFVILIVFHKSKLLVNLYVPLWVFQISDRLQVLKRAYN